MKNSQLAKSFTKKNSHLIEDLEATCSTFLHTLSHCLTANLFSRAESVTRSRARSIEHTVTTKDDLNLALVRS